MLSEQFAKAIYAQYIGYKNRTGTGPDCVIVQNEEMLAKVDAALLLYGVSVNGIIDEGMPRRTLLFTREADLESLTSSGYLSDAGLTKVERMAAIRLDKETYD